MSNSYFRFKQFTVHHDRCAMKVGTDGVLLGAWADVGDSPRIVDIGTGTGLIALMLAQRNPQARITAIDVDEDAIAQAMENISYSPFSDRITLKHLSLQEFSGTDNGGFDHLVTNPPFFIGSLRPPDEARSRTRHADTLTLNELFSFGRKLAAENGKLSLILPFEQKNSARMIANENGWHISRATSVYSLPQKPPKRILMQFSVTPLEIISEDELIIEWSHHVYTPEFTSLVKEFYLHL